MLEAVVVVVADDERFIMVPATSIVVVGVVGVVGVVKSMDIS